jgi:hypothetical protein
LKPERIASVGKQTSENIYTCNTSIKRLKIKRLKQLNNYCQTTFVIFVLYLKKPFQYLSFFSSEKPNQSFEIWNLVFKLPKISCLFHPTAFWLLFNMWCEGEAERGYSVKVVHVAFLNFIVIGIIMRHLIP